jgi:multidrug efflux pump subunit AcrB
VQLTKDHHPTAAYVERLRGVLARQYPGVTFYVLPVDIVTQILNFGLSAPIDIQVVGPDLYGNRALAERMLDEVRYVPGAADARIQQPFDYPNMTVNVDRTRAQTIGLTQKDVATSLLVALSGSFQTAPASISIPKRRHLQRRRPGSAVRVDSLAALESLPITGTTEKNRRAPAPPPPRCPAPPPARRSCIPCRCSATWRPSSRRGAGHGEPLRCAAGHRHLRQRGWNRSGHGDRAWRKNHRRTQSRAAARLALHLRGQSETMKSSYIGLLGGLAFSILLVYLLIVVNFQSWLDPFLIISALPAALAGIVWFLFLTNTRLSVPALTGAIMCMGVATANSILVVSFAREQLEVLVGDARRAALNAGFVRLRPVLMTALAMIIGMVPMALGLGDGGEQNAPLGRAVIGGLLLATVATLFFVPAFFSVVHGWLEGRRRRLTALATGRNFDEFDELSE